MLNYQRVSFWCETPTITMVAEWFWSIAIHSNRAPGSTSSQHSIPVNCSGGANWKCLEPFPFTGSLTMLICQGIQSTTWKPHEAAGKHGNKCASHVWTNSATANWNASIHMFYIWTVDAGVALGKACDTKSKWGTQWETASWASGMGLLIYIYNILQEISHSPLRNGASQSQYHGV